MGKRKQSLPEVWEVWHGSTLICSAAMGLTCDQALNKVLNERRLGIVMTARPAPKGKSLVSMTIPERGFLGC